MKFAFVRETTEARPIDNKEFFVTCKKAEIAEHNVFSDGNKSNEERDELLSILEKDDVLLTRSVVDLSNSVDKMVKILQYLQQQKVKLFSLEEDRLNGHYPYSNYKQLKNVAMYYAELKRKKAYDAALKAKKVGRPKESEKTDKAIRMYRTCKFTVDEIVEMAGISKSTFYRAVKEYKADLERKIKANEESIAAADAAEEEEKNWSS